MACTELGIPYRNMLTEETYEQIKNDGKPMQTDAALSDLYNNLSKL